MILKRIKKISLFACLLLITACGAGGASNPEEELPKNSYRLGGTAQGLGAEPVVLKLQGLEQRSLHNDGQFQFDFLLPAGDFKVEIQSQPSDRHCEISNNQGNNDGKDFLDIQVTCELVFRVGGYFQLNSNKTSVKSVSISLIVHDQITNTLIATEEMIQNSPAGRNTPQFILEDAKVRENDRVNTRIEVTPVPKDEKVICGSAPEIKQSSSPLVITTIWCDLKENA